MAAFYTDSFTPPSLLPGANGLQVSLFFPQWPRSPPFFTLPALESIATTIGADPWGLSPPTGQSGEVQDAGVSLVIRFVGFGASL